MLFLLYIKLTPQSVTEHHTHTCLHTQSHGSGFECSLWQSSPFPSFETPMRTHTIKLWLLAADWMEDGAPLASVDAIPGGELPPLNSILYPTGVWLLSRIPQLTHSRLYIQPCSGKPCKTKGKGWCDIGTVDIRMRLHLDCESIDLGCVPFGIELNWDFFFFIQMQFMSLNWGTVGIKNCNSNLIVRKYN